MKTLLRLCVAITAAFCAAGSFAYDPKYTHSLIMDAAVDNSVLATDPNVLPNLGLKPFALNQLFTHHGLTRLVDEFSAGVPYPPGTKGTISALFRLGVLVEDDGTRATNHFYDPISGLAANVGGVQEFPLLVAKTITSPSWALEDRGEIGEQSNSFRDARNYMFLALTTGAGAPLNQAALAREVLWSQTFQSLGEVVHHIQDMAQPQHVRNDIHLDEYEWYGLNPFYNPSKYEVYGRERAVIDNIKRLARTAQAAAVYPGPAEFNTARDFWKNAAGSGLAEFTNRNFVSQGTNFRMYQGQASTTGYALPRPGAPQVYTIAELYDAQGTSVPTGIQSLCSNVGVNCKMTMYPTPLTAKASTLSIFDQDMQAKGLSVTYNDDDDKPIYRSDRLFALNRFNFDAAHETLIPKAVSYSAGLINYFFRGKLDFVPDPNTPDTYTIKNLLAEDMNGAFSFFYDATNGTRNAIPDATWNLVIPANGQSAPLTLRVPTNPAPEEEGKYLLVFKGSMGQEALTAVAAKLKCALPQSNDGINVQVGQAVTQTQFDALAPIPDVITTTCAYVKKETTRYSLGNVVTPYKPEVPTVPGTPPVYAVQLQIIVSLATIDGPGVQTGIYSSTEEAIPEANRQAASFVPYPLPLSASTLTSASFEVAGTDLFPVALWENSYVYVTVSRFVVKWQVATVQSTPAGTTTILVNSVSAPISPRFMGATITTPGIPTVYGSSAVPATYALITTKTTTYSPR